jgi:hypothetical protein
MTSTAIFTSPGYANRLKRKLTSAPPLALDSTTLRE